MADRLDLAEALAQAAREINQPQDVATVLEAIVHLTAQTVPGFEHVGVSVAHRDGTIETKASTDQLVRELDTLQYELGEGPCVYAIREEPVTAIDQVGHDERWPRYGPEAARRGVRSQMGVRLYVDEQTLGGLNLYSTSTGHIDPEQQEWIEPFAAHAALALGHASQREHLNTALDTRKLIGQAIGIVMERYQLNEDRAFKYLMRVSQHGNVKLRDVAAELVAQSNDRTGHTA